MDNEITILGKRGVRVDGRFLSNLRFADDIVLFSSSTNEAETMLNELNEAGKRIGLRINRKKTQFMKNADVFAARMDQLRAQLDTAQGPRQCHSRSLRTSWMKMARERNEWKRCWGLTSSEESSLSI
ncbi:hypothetical protein RB195_010597 [Necator americanus]